MNRCNRGFSLVEVVLALEVIGFSLLAIIGLLPIGLQSGRASIQETRANHLAEQIFSTLRSQPFTAADLSQLGGNSTVNLWPNGVVCPRCGSKGVTYLENAKVWKCKTAHPKQKFSAKVGRFLKILLSVWTSGCPQCGSLPTAKTALARTSFIVRLA
jgi:uncharacterized protein (TIGR02598 family)